MTAPARAQGKAEVRTALVQLAPCCLDHMWDVSGRYDRARLAAHLVAQHGVREVPWPT